MTRNTQALDENVIITMLAVLGPLICYLVVRKYSEDAVTMPRHYAPDSIVQYKENGKLLEDTVWRQIDNFHLTNQLGEKVTLDSLKGKIIVADFFFTHCPSICPAMTKNMKKLSESINNAQKVGDKTNTRVHFLSFTFDPERDSVAQLKKWADRFQVNPDQWWLLTGDKEQLYDLAQKMMLGIVDGKGDDTAFQHTDHFVLIDSTRHLRGYYQVLRDPDALKKLSNDLILLTMEKDRTKKSFLAGKLQLLAIVFLIAIAAVGIFLLIFKKKDHYVVSRMEKK
ncbi:MAG: SCO family protein [Pedobacter sp.]|nr:MAG: SCO family protein [Pedobacter sp.]